MRFGQTGAPVENSTTRYDFVVYPYTQVLTLGYTISGGVYLPLHYWDGLSMGHLGITQDVTVTPSGPSPPSPLGVSPNTTLWTNVRRPQKETADNPPHPSPLSHILPLPGIASLIWSLYSNACWSGDM